MIVNFFVALSSKWKFSATKKNHGAFIIFGRPLGNLSPDKKLAMKIFA